jgi:hypothetical protein
MTAYMRFVLALAIAASLAAQDRGFIPVKAYTPEQDKEILSSTRACAWPMSRTASTWSDFKMSGW